METITINVDEGLAKKFRKMAELRFGRKKGYLSKATSEAFSYWLNKEDDVIGEALKIIDKGIYAPQLRYKKRSELYERAH